MGFLRRLWSGTTPRPDRDGMVDAVLFDPPKSGSVAVVGESNYQQALRRVSGGSTEEGTVEADHLAALVPEPTNRYDRNAIRVVIDNQLVGYLSREDAIAYRPVAERLARQGRIMAARATLTGGWDRGRGDRGSFGVVLGLGTPDELMDELDQTEAR